MWGCGIYGSSSNSSWRYIKHTMRPQREREKHQYTSMLATNSCIGTIVTWNIQIDGWLWFTLIEKRGECNLVWRKSSLNQEYDQQFSRDQLYWLMLEKRYLQVEYLITHTKVFLNKIQLMINDQCWSDLQERSLHSSDRIWSNFVPLVVVTVIVISSS